MNNSQRRAKKRLTKKGRILRRQGGQCCYCGSRLHLSQATFDHVVPQSAGGRRNGRNLVVSCFSCNNKRGDRPVAEFMRDVHDVAIGHGPTPTLGDIMKETMNV